MIPYTNPKNARNVTRPLLLGLLALGAILTVASTPAPADAPTSCGEASAEKETVRAGVRIWISQGIDGDGCNGVEVYSETFVCQGPDETIYPVTVQLFADSGYCTLAGAWIE